MRTLKFIINPMNVVDLVAFAPFWILGGMDDPPFAVPSLDSPGGSAFGFVRAIRLVRVFRVFKVGKLALGFKMMAGAIANSMETMSVLMIVMGVVVTLFSSIMHLIEAPGSALATDELIDAAGMGPCLLADGNRTADCMQSICFGTIPSTFWWAFTTMTTVGYGDCYPVTWAGKMVSVLTFIVGIGVLGLIVTVLGNNFSAQVEMCAAPSRRRRRRRRRAHSPSPPPDPSTRDAHLATAPGAHTGTRRRRRRTPRST